MFSMLFQMSNVDFMRFGVRNALDSLFFIAFGLHYFCRRVFELLFEGLEGIERSFETVKKSH